MMRNIPVAAALAAAVALAACGDDESASQTAGTTSAPSTPASIDLRIDIAADADEGAQSTTWTLRCDPNSGTWPSVGPACERLTPKVLSPIEIETRDLQQITGQPVRVSGRAFGADVSVEIPAQGSGTRLARLKALREALGPSAFDEAERRSR